MERVCRFRKNSGHLAMHLLDREGSRFEQALQSAGSLANQLLDARFVGGVELGVKTDGRFVGVLGMWGAAAWWQPIKKRPRWGPLEGLGWLGGA